MFGVDVQLEDGLEYPRRYAHMSIGEVFVLRKYKTVGQTLPKHYG